MSSLKISAVIITYNEERNIARCIDSIAEVADEILVIDSYSTDKTPDICRKKGAKVLQNAFEGYSDQKNYGNERAAYDYILSLDADEALSSELAASIIAVKNADQPIPCKFNRMTNYCGRWIRFGGWYPDRKLRLWDRREGKWKGSKVHEKVVLFSGGKEKHLKGDLLHYSYYNIEEHHRQIEKYSKLAAEDALEKGKKSNYFKLIVNPALKFFRDYILRLGFLDGYYGYIVAWNSAYSKYLKYLKMKKQGHGLSQNNGQ